MLKIRRPLGRLIFNMGIAIPGKTVFLIETAPSFLQLILSYYLINTGHQPDKFLGFSGAWSLTANKNIVFWLVKIFT